MGNKIVNYFMVILFAVFVYVIYQEHEDDKKYPYIVTAYDLDHRTTTYAYTNKPSSDGCLLTTKGRVCGTFRIKNNPSHQYYEE